MLTTSMATRHWMQFGVDESSSMSESVGGGIMGGEAFVALNVLSAMRAKEGAGARTSVGASGCRTSSEAW